MFKKKKDKPIADSNPPNDLLYKMFDKYLEINLNDSDRDSELIGTHLRSLFYDLMRSADLTKCIEIGAYEASFSRVCKNEFPDTKVIAYEANPYVYERFGDNLQKGGVDYRFACVAGENGKQTFTVPKDFRGSERNMDNQMASLMTNIHTEENETFDVDSVRLDDDIDLQDNDKLALWVDVEGATKYVFSGALKSLEKTPLIYIEVESRPIWDGQWLDTDVYQFLSARGFVPVARDSQRIHQFNYIYINSNLLDPHRFVRAYNRYLHGKNEFSS